MAPRVCAGESTVLRGVTGEWNFNTLRNQALAAFLAAAAQEISPSLGCHAGAEAELLFAGALGGLIGAFAHDVRMGK
jgi:hypothetical protein